MTKHLSDWTVGIDLGDRVSVLFGLNRESGEVIESELEMAEAAVREHFASFERCRIVFEAGGHSRWMNRVLSEMGFEVIVADPRQLALITKSTRKNDRNDARRLAELGSAHVANSLELLRPIAHRDDQMQADLTVLKARDRLVRMRTALINEIRGSVKSMGYRLRRCSTPYFHNLVDEIPDILSEALRPLFVQLKMLSEQIRAYDRKIVAIQQERYPEIDNLLAIRGVGAMTAMAFRLVVADACRFKRSRDVGAYLGLTPRQHESGSIRKDLGITKTGDRYVRRLLVHAAQYILGPFGEDCDLRRWGEHLASRGGSSAKKRAVVAVARKLAVVMHRIWADQSEYEPLRNQEHATAA